MPESFEEPVEVLRYGGAARCSLRSLEAILDLPAGWRIRRIIHDDSVFDLDEVTLLIEGPGLPVVQPGHRLQRINLRYTRAHFDGWELLK